MTDDQSRPVATTPDGEFTLSIDEALARYTKAGLPRTPRSVQRYCAKGHLECRLIETSFGEKYLITPTSVDKHIAYIEEVSPMTSRGMPRLVATDVGRENSDIHELRQPATDHDQSRPVATTPDSSRYVEQLEGEVIFLRSQIGKKDDQIAALLDRDKETNTLIHRLQAMLAPLLVSPADRRETPEHNGGRS